jgi:ATP-dependent Zn protease
VLLAAWNHPERLDPALVRSGRLDRHIRLHLPDQAALARILREHLGADLADESLSGGALAAAGASGADCERFVRGARRRAREAGRTMILADLVTEIGGADDRTDAELQVIAIHEAGHALASCTLRPGTLKAVTLSPSGNAWGATKSVEASGYIYAADVQARLVFLLAGRAAEEVALGRASSGAGGGANSDLAVATRLAVMAATGLGLDRAAGLVWFGVPDAATLPKVLADDATLVARVRTALDKAYADALGLVRRRRAALDGLAGALLERRALDGAEAAAIVASLPGDAA